MKAKGDITKAITSYQKAYQLNPSYGDAFWSLANTKTYRFSDEEISQMQSQQTNIDLPQQIKYSYSSQQGKLLKTDKITSKLFSLTSKETSYNMILVALTLLK